MKRSIFIAVFARLANRARIMLSSRHCTRIRSINHLRRHFMRSRFFAGGLAASAAIFIALPAAAQESPKALQEAFAAAVVAEDAAALGALYTDDAISYGPGGDISVGPEAISASWAPFFDGYDGFSVTLDQQGETAIDKKAHAAWGLWSMTATPVDGGEPMTWTGRFTDVSVKTDKGWKYRNDHASPTAPAE
jgi:uncharacterized protein (TIGR02246 family)